MLTELSLKALKYHTRAAAGNTRAYAPPRTEPKAAFAKRLFLQYHPASPRISKCDLNAESYRRGFLKGHLRSHSLKAVIYGNGGRKQPPPPFTNSEHSVPKGNPLHGASACVSQLGLHQFSCLF